MEVYFDGSFWNSGEGRVPCKQTGVAKEFQWKGHSWQILGLYTSEGGLILDFAKQVSIEEIRSFDEKWLEKKYFHAEVDRSRKPFTIVIPPPNVTGRLHMGLGGPGPAHKR